jgi:hypothetical protein
MEVLTPLMALQRRTPSQTSISCGPILDTIPAKWYSVLHDVVPASELLNKINLLATNT